MKFLTKSDHSDIYEDFDDTHGHIVIKKLGSRIDGSWLKRQNQGYDIINKLTKTYDQSEIGVNLPQLISIAGDINNPNEDAAIIEKHINGKSFSADIYNSLTNKNKNALAKQMALFLNAMHQLQDPNKPDESIKVAWEKEKVMEKINKLNETVDAFKGKLSQTSTKLISSAEKYLKQATITDEIHVLTHRDLHRKNLMYDPDTNQMTVIDFELSRTDNIYRDFVPYMATASIPWDFIQRIVKQYNRIPNKKHPIFIDIKKLKNAIIYGVARIHARDIDLHFNGDVDLVSKRLDNFLQSFFFKNTNKFHDAKERLIIKQKSNSNIKALLTRQSQNN